MLCIVLAAANIVTVSAWKPKTHVYIGDLLISEINENNGYVEIPPYGMFKVKKEYLAAIKGYQSYFLGGCVGPDSFPDIYVGQAFIHPNETTTSGQWLSDLWNRVNSMPTGDAFTSEASMHYVPFVEGRSKQMLEGVIPATSSRLTQTQLKNASLAFVLGCMVHGAGDFFGHDWVNKWAQGSFPAVADGLTPSESQIIARHMLVESLVDKAIIYKHSTYINSPRTFVMNNMMANGSIANGLNPLFSQDKPLHFDQFFKLRAALVHEASTTTVNLWRDYANAWIQDIDAGLTAWIYANAEIARVVVDPKRSLEAISSEEEEKTVDAQDVLSAWADQYLMSMLGAPDLLLEITDILGAIPAAIDEQLKIFEPLKKSLRDYAIDWLCQEAMGMDKETLEAYSKNPELYINSDLFPAGSLNTIKTEMANIGSNDLYNVNPADVILEHTFEPFYNTLTMAKLILIGNEGVDELISRAVGRQVTFYTAPDRINKPIIDFMRSFDESFDYNAVNFPLFTDAEFRQKVFYMIFPSYLQNHTPSSSISSINLAMQKINDVTGSVHTSWFDMGSGTFSSSLKLPTQIKVTTNASKDIELYVFNSNHRLLYKGTVPKGSNTTYIVTDLYGKGSIYAYATAKEDNDIMKGYLTSKFKYDFPAYRAYASPSAANGYYGHYVNLWAQDGWKFNNRPYVSTQAKNDAVLEGYGRINNFDYLWHYAAGEIWKVGDPQVMFDSVKDLNIEQVKDNAKEHNLEWAFLVGKSFSSDTELTNFYNNCYLTYSDDSLRFIPAEEASVIGAKEEIDFGNGRIYSFDNVFHMTGVSSTKPVPDNLSAQAAVDFIRSFSAMDLVIANHPGRGDSMYPLSNLEEIWPISYDAYEAKVTGSYGSNGAMVVINGRYDKYDKESINNWIKYHLLKGKKTTAVAGSGEIDNIARSLESGRTAERIGTAVTAVNSTSNSYQDICRDIIKGKAFVSTGPGVSFYIQKAADASTNPSKFYGIGDSVYTSSTGEAVRIYITAVDNSCSKDFSISNSVYLYRGTIGGTEELLGKYGMTDYSFAKYIGDPYTGGTVIKAVPGTYYRVEVRSDTNNKRVALSNPIWIEQEINIPIFPINW